MTHVWIALLGSALLLLHAARADAQTSPPPEPAPASAPAPAEEERSTGLPKGVHWTFNFDAGLGWFSFGNSLYTNAHPDPPGDLGANWAEAYIKPALSGTVDVKKSVFYFKISAVGAGNFAAPPSVVGEDASSFGVEDLYIGWRSGTSLDIGDDSLDFTVGRARYRIGHGFLIWDGAGEGGSRGAFWSNARQAWHFAGIARVKLKSNTFEAFYLDRDELPESDTGTTLWGANYELAIGEKTTLGATYLRTSSDEEIVPLRNGMNVYDVRAFTAPFSGLPDLAFELEYAREKNGDVMDSYGWTAQASYELSHVSWMPKLTYRYAFFEGDDPDTTTNEAFDPLFLGFYDWGTWWQGEIAGEYFLSNSNLISDMLRLSLTPNESVGWGLIAYQFRLDQPGSYLARVTSRDIAFEIDGYCDWKINKNFTLSAVAAYANPQEAVQQAFGRTENFLYGMLYVTYSY